MLIFTRTALFSTPPKMVTSGDLNLLDRDPGFSESFPDVLLVEMAAVELHFLFVNFSTAH